MDELFTPDENVRRLQAVGVDPLFIAINTGDLGAVKRLIAGLPVDCTHLVADCGDVGRTPLERACYSGRVDIVNFLIREGADVQRHGMWNRTPLHSILYHAHSNDHIACAKLLIAEGADVNATGDTKWDSPFDMAIRRRGRIYDQIVRVFLQAGATISDLKRYQLNRPEDTHYNSPYLKKIVKAGNFKAYSKAHRQKLVAMFVRTRCFQRVPAEIVPLIVDYSFHVGFY